MTPQSKEKRTLPREHYNAIRRVLELVDGYISEQRSQHTLMAHDGGLMTWAELREHIHAAIKLMPVRPSRKRS